MTSREAAEHLAIHINTLHRWTAKGLIKSYRIGPRGDYRYRLSDLEAFVEKEQDGDS